MKTPISCLTARKPLMLALVLLAPLPALPQGSLTPSGAPAPSMKSLAQIEPRTPISAVPITISNAGSYYFTTNLTGLSGTNGITISAGDVTLDLNGFALVGVPGALTGITSAAPALALTVRNGTIRNWPAGAIVAPGADATFESLNVYSNTGSFALSAGAQARVRRCTVAMNAAGISVGAGGSISDSVIRHNTGHGLSASESAAVMNCVVYGNTGHGLSVSNASTVEGCTIKTNGQNGLVGLADVRVARCNISQNSSNGINLTLAGRVAECVISSNRLDGIRITARCAIAGNLIDFNGTATNNAGIRVLSSDNRIEDNQITSNITGLLSDLGYNLIVRNKATLNTTNFALHVDDIAGPITDNPTTAGPWANFAY